MTRDLRAKPLVAVATLVALMPAAVAAQECSPAISNRLNQASRGGIEYEVRRKETAMRPPASVFDLGCLNTLMSLNLNIFSGGLPTLDMLLAMGTRMLCSYAQQEFSRLTAPLNRSFSIPGLPGGLGSALGLSTLNLGSVGVGGGSGGVSLNGGNISASDFGNYSAGSVLGNGGWLTGSPTAGTGYGTAPDVAVNGAITAPTTTVPDPASTPMPVSTGTGVTAGSTAGSSIGTSTQQPTSWQSIWNSVFGNTGTATTTPPAAETPTGTGTTTP